MRLPPKSDDLARFAKDTIDECLVSREIRRQSYSAWTRIFYTGSNDGQPSKHNRIFSHVDKLSSYLFSPAEVRFVVDFESSEEPEWRNKADRASRYLNRMFARREVDTAFSEANVWALVKGATILRVNWGKNGFEPWVVQPDFFGVRNESMGDLDRQDAFVFTSLVTETQLNRLLAGHKDRAAIMKLVGSAFDAASAQMFDGGWIPGSITGLGNFNTGGGIAIPGIVPGNSSGSGQVDMISAPPTAVLAPEVQARLIELHELWVWDDEREDYTTIQYVDPGVLLDGKYQRRNATGVKGCHPFVRVCSNEVPNYFWGRSEIAAVWPNQRMLNARVENIDSMYRLAASPPRAFRGFSGLTAEKMRALLSPGATLTDGAPSGTTSIDTLKPEIPAGYMDYINKIEGWFDESGGFTAMTNGQGEPGIRSGNHANTLLRTSTPRLRDRALLVEKQAAKTGELCLYIAQAKDAKVLKTDEGDEFMLSQLPDDASVVVDSHTSSPAFSGEAEQKAMALHRVNAIDNIDLIRQMHMPNEDELVAAEKRREKAHQKMMEELKAADPEAWAKAVSGASSRRR